MMQSKDRTLLNNFDNAITSAIKKAISDKSLTLSKDMDLEVGALMIQKVGDQYVVMNGHSGQIYYETDFLDNALYLAHQHQCGKYESIRRLLQIEREYNKNAVDMEFYLHTYRQLREDDSAYCKFSIEDRYYVSRELKLRAKRSMRDITKTFSKRVNRRKCS